MQEARRASAGASQEAGLDAEEDVATGPPLSRPAPDRAAVNLASHEPPPHASLGASERSGRCDSGLIGTADDSFFGVLRRERPET